MLWLSIVKPLITGYPLWQRVPEQEGLGQLWSAHLFDSVHSTYLAGRCYTYTVARSYTTPIKFPSAAIVLLGICSDPISFEPIKCAYGDRPAFETDSYQKY